MSANYLRSERASKGISFQYLIVHHLPLIAPPKALC